YAACPLGELPFSLSRLQPANCRCSIQLAPFPASVSGLAFRARQILCGRETQANTFTAVILPPATRSLLERQPGPRPRAAPSRPESICGFSSRRRRRCCDCGHRRTGRFHCKSPWYAFGQGTWLTCADG